MKSIEKYRRITNLLKNKDWKKVEPKTLLKNKDWKKVGPKNTFKKRLVFSKLSLHFIPYTSYNKIVWFCYTFLKSVFFKSVFL